LSASTERIDRREKLLAYQSLPSLQEYLLVSQERREVQIHRRSTDWAAERLTGGSVRLDCLAGELALETIYEEIEV
jgi:Uma2 family endonuclease